jgi:hypothetical protein
MQPSVKGSNSPSSEFMEIDIQSPPPDDGTSKIVENVVLVLGIVTTIAAYIWIQRKIKAATPAFVYGRRKARQDEGGAPSHYIDVSLPAEA